MELEEGVDTFGSEAICSNCRGHGNRKPIHCKVKNGEPIVTCNNKACKCKCRTHYACRFGRLHPYDQKCKCKQNLDDEKIKSTERELWWENRLKELGIHPEQIDKKLNNSTPK